MSSPGSGEQGAPATDPDLTEPGTSGVHPSEPDAGGRSVLGGSAALLGARYLQAALGYVGSVVIARTLSDTEYGGYTLVFGVLGIVGILCDVQASRLVLRQVLDAGAAAGRPVGSYMALRLVVALSAYLLTVGGMAAAGYPSEVVVATVVAGAVIPLGATWSALRILFEARLWLRSLSAMTIAAQLVQVGLTLAIAIGGDGSLVWFMAPAVTYNLVFLLVMAVIARRHVTLGFRVDRSEWWRWIRDSAPIALGAALGEAYFRIDAVMLSKLDTLEAVGRYGIGYKFSDLIGFASAAVMASAFTVLVRSWPDSPEAFRRTVHGVTVLLSVLAAGLAGGFLVFARPAIELLYGQRFADAAGAARLLVVGQGIAFLTNLCFYVLLATGRHRRFPVAALLGLVVNVGLNLVLIPRHSIVGAGVATVITEALVLLVLALGAAAIPEVRGVPWAILVRVLAAGAALVAVGAGADLVLPWPVAAVAAAVVYAAAVHRLAVPGGLPALWASLRADGDDTRGDPPDEPAPHRAALPDGA